MRLSAARHRSERTCKESFEWFRRKLRQTCESERSAEVRSAGKANAKGKRHELTRRARMKSVRTSTAVAPHLNPLPKERELAPRRSIRGDSDRTFLPPVTCGHSISAGETRGSTMVNVPVARKSIPPVEPSAMNNGAKRDLDPTDVGCYGWNGLGAPARS